MNSSRVVGDVLPADGLCVARKLCPCTRSRQTHALGSRWGIAQRFPNALERRKGLQRTPHSAQKRSTKSRRVEPQPPTVPQRKWHPLGSLVKADDCTVHCLKRRLGSGSNVTMGWLGEVYKTVTATRWCGTLCCTVPRGAGLAQRDQGYMYFGALTSARAKAVAVARACPMPETNGRVALCFISCSREVFMWSSLARTILFRFPSPRGRLRVPHRRTVRCRRATGGAPKSSGPQRACPGPRPRACSSAHGPSRQAGPRLIVTRDDLHQLPHSATGARCP